MQAQTFSSKLPLESFKLWQSVWFENNRICPLLCCACSPNLPILVFRFDEFCFSKFIFFKNYELEVFHQNRNGTFCTLRNVFRNLEIMLFDLISIDFKTSFPKDHGLEFSHRGTSKSWWTSRYKNSLLSQNYGHLIVQKALGIFYTRLDSVFKLLSLNSYKINECLSSIFFDNFFVIGNSGLKQHYCVACVGYLIHRPCGKTLIVSTICRDAN